MPTEAPPHTPEATPSTPTTQQSGSGRPTTRVPLPEGLLNKISDLSAKNLAPASQVQQTSATPIAKDANTPATEPAPKAAPQPATLAKAADAAPAAKPAGSTGAGDEGKPAQPAKKDGIAQVREALERAEARARELEGSLTATAKEKADAFTKVAEFEAKVKGYEEKFAKEWEPQLKQLAEREKQARELEEKLRVKDYTATAEFHNNYVKPIAETHQEALQFIGELVANVDGGQVQATQEHLNYVIGAPNANEAARRAEQLFGATFTPQLVNYRQRLRALEGKRAEAMQRASVESETFFKRQQEEQLAQQARFKQRVQERVSNYLVKPADNDPEEQAAFQRGQAFAESVEQGSRDPEQWADMVARVKAHAASRDVLELRLKRQADELTAVKAELARYQRTEPDVTTGGSTSPSATSAKPAEVGKSGIHDDILSKARAIARGRVG